MWNKVGFNQTRNRRGGGKLKWLKRAVDYDTTTDYAHGEEFVHIQYFKGIRQYIFLLFLMSFTAISPSIGHVQPDISSGSPRGGGGGVAPGPHLNRAPTLEQEPEISMFFKLVRAFLKLRAPYSSSTCSLAKS
jgi:hypothetical protein